VHAREPFLLCVVVCVAGRDSCSLLLSVGRHPSTVDGWRGHVHGLLRARRIGRKVQGVGFGCKLLV
jgi:hypothetical protein